MNFNFFQPKGSLILSPSFLSKSLPSKLTTVEAQCQCVLSHLGKRDLDHFISSATQGWKLVTGWLIWKSISYL